MDQDIVLKAEVVVVMPVHNAETFLGEAIESILNQTYRDFLFLIIDDSSTDSSYNVASSYRDNRIVLRRNIFNKGIVDTLNEAFSSIKATYIIRMDADDIAVANRIEEQVNFMNLHPDIAISGTWYSTIGSDQIVKMPGKDDEIAVHLLETTALGHPTVIIRQEIWDKFKISYKKAHLHTEDYACWCEAKMKGCKLANIPSVLLKYRRHGSQVSQKNSSYQNINAQKIQLNYFEYYFPGFLGFDQQVYKGLFTDELLNNEQYLKVKKFYSRIVEYNAKNKIFNEEHLQKFLYDKFGKKVFQQYVILNNPVPATFFLAIADPFFYKVISPFQKLSFFIKLPLKLMIKLI